MLLFVATLGWAVILNAGRRVLDVATPDVTVNHWELTSAAEISVISGIV
ncbi:MAG: hypothetical protein ACYCT1_06895 [Steroidobacteraceae bacterium]